LKATLASVALRRELDGGDYLPSGQSPPSLDLTIMRFELIEILQIGVGRYVGDREIALGLTGRGLKSCSP